MEAVSRPHHSPEQRGEFYVITPGENWMIVDNNRGVSVRAGRPRQNSPIRTGSEDAT
jgi:hypothetical protein